MKVTGPKTDVWLVKTVGVIVLAIGAALLVAVARHAVTPDMYLLAVASAAGLGGIDVYYVMKGTIDRIYLADAAAEAVLIALWALALVQPRLTRQPRCRPLLRLLLTSLSSF